jgi:pimeloyl-ACP methyl ester carboxylesterase
MAMEKRTGTLSRPGSVMSYETFGSGPPLLLLHGFFGAGSDFQYAFDLERLAADYEVTLPDLRGHGRSTNEHPTFTHRQCAADVLALVDSLGHRSVRAVGLSLGANALLHAASWRPSAFQTLVLVSGTTHCPPEARAIQGSLPPEPSLDEWPVLRAKHVHGDAQILALRRFARAFADDTDDLRFTDADLARIAMATLIVYGDRDPLYPVEIAVRMYRQMPRAALWVVPGGGHGPIFGPDRPEFERRAQAFLRELPEPADGSIGV